MDDGVGNLNHSHVRSHNIYTHIIMYTTHTHTHACTRKHTHTRLCTYHTHTDVCTYPYTQHIAHV